MKIFKKIMPIGLALALSLGSMVNVYAYQLDNVNYDGIQVNDTLYSLDYIIGNEGTFGDLFGPSDSTKVILDFNQKAAKFSDYLTANPADFDAWASVPANQTPANPAKLVKADGTIVEIGAEEELSIVDFDIQSRTKIVVTFSDDSTKTLDVNLVNGSNTVAFDHQDVHFTRTFNFTIDEVAVASIELVNYRELVVTFNDLVDEESAENPANYYFAILEGNGQMLGADNTLKNSLSFAEINDEDSQVVITADSSAGYTVATVHFPEDARFTYRLDDSTWRDSERVIIIEKANGEEVALDEGETVTIAVRNITVDGQYVVNTVPHKIEIKDLVKPDLVHATKYMTNNAGEIKAIETTLNGLINIDNSRVDRTSDFTLTFTEPVFDGHKSADDGQDNPEIWSDVNVFINDTLVTDTDKRNFENIMQFNMDEENSYADACDVTINLYEAVEKYIDKTFGDEDNFWNVGKNYNVKIKGVVDLATNIQTSSTINFDFKLVEPPTSGTVITYDPPKVEKVVQVADNVLRVYFDQPVTDFTFVIEGADGDSGNITKEFADILTGEFGINDDLYFYDVYLPASDFDFNGWPEGILSYKNQSFINTKVLIKEIFNMNQDESQEGDSKYFPMTLVKDIDAPEAVEAYIEDAGDDYETITENSRIMVALEDVTPFDENVEPSEVRVAKYEFGRDEFKDNIDLFHGDFLPVTVSYVDDNGVTHKQVVSNQEDLAHNPGILGAINYDYINDTLEIDLNLGQGNAFVQLLNDDGKLIEGATYTISIPKGYFADEMRMDEYFGNYPPETKLYVDNGRGAWCEGFGFASEAMTLTFTVPVRAEEEEQEYYGVPQTTKEMITWDEVENVIEIEFTGDIDADTLKNPANYSLDGVALPANTDIEYRIDNQGTISNLVDDRKFAVITLPENTVAVDGFVLLTIKDVANPDGGKMAPITEEDNVKVELSDNTRPSLEGAVVSGESEIVLTFSEPLEYKAGENSGTAAYNFEVRINGAPCTVNDASINIINDVRQVTLSVNGTVIKKGDVVKVTIQEMPNGAVNIEDRAKKQNPIELGTFNVGNPTQQ